MGSSINQDGVRRSAYELLAYPETSTWLGWPAFGPNLAAIDPKTAERLETEARYAVYLDRQQADAAQIRREEQRSIPADLDFSARSWLVQ